jgi:hypothetical protein
MVHLDISLDAALDEPSSCQRVLFELNLAVDNDSVGLHKDFARLPMTYISVFHSMN